MRYDNVKRAFDVVAAGTGLVALSPVLAAVGVAVWLDVGRPVVFRQQRAGRGGAPFSILKFRTMRDAVGPDGEPLPDGDRLTSVGDFLRHSSLDELPQLWNVLRGEMSLIGPRALYADYVELYDAEQARRLEVRPGITGYAAVKGRNSLDWDTQFEYDVWYVDHIGPLVDLMILLRTVTTVLSREGVNQEGTVSRELFTGGSDRGTR